jgi:hypothetical protein
MDEPFSLSVTMDSEDHKQDATKSSCVGSFGMLTTPTQALALNVHQAPLNDYAWPQCSHDPENRWISIDGSCFWFKALIFESLTELQ